ncbi:MAG: zinc metalloprotease HtpX [Thermoprotei archaeon]
MGLRANMFAAAILTLLAEVIVVSLILLVTRLPLVDLIFILGLFWLIQYLAGPMLIARNSREIVVGDPTHGWLHDVVGELSQRAGISKPKVYISDERFPNAFAFGNPFKKGIAFTTPLLQILTPDELKAVAGHELGHLKHRDVELGTTLGLIPNVLNWVGSSMIAVGSTWLGLIVTDFDIALAFAILILGWIITILALFVNVFLLWFNRLRESYADLHSLELMGKEGVNLATALAKIQVYMKNVRLDPFRGMVVTVPPQKIKSTNPDDLLREWLREKPKPWSDILLSHPHPARRIRMIVEQAGTPTLSNTPTTSQTPNPQ